MVFDRESVNHFELLFLNSVRMNADNLFCLFQRIRRVVPAAEVHRPDDAFALKDVLADRHNHYVADIDADTINLTTA